MNRTRVGVLQPTFSVIISVVMVLILIWIFWMYSPRVAYGSLSPCYGSAVSNARALSGPDLLREPQTIKLGTCVGGLYFVNENDLDEASGKIEEGHHLKEELDCPEDGKSYIIIIPLIEGGEGTWDIFKWPKEAMKEIKQRVLEKLWDKAICQIASREWTFKNPTALKGGEETYCVDYGKNDDKTYTVYFCVGICDDCGPNPYNPSYFSTKPGDKTKWFELREGVVSKSSTTTEKKTE